LILLAAELKAAITAQEDFLLEFKHNVFRFTDANKVLEDKLKDADR